MQKIVFLKNKKLVLISKNAEIKYIHIDVYVHWIVLVPLHVCLPQLKVFLRSGISFVLFCLAEK